MFVPLAAGTTSSASNWWDSLTAWVAVVGALITAAAGVYLAYRARLHERAQQLREQMLLNADEALETFQQTGTAIGYLLSAEHRPEGKALTDALARAEELCGASRARAARIALLFHPASPARHLAVRIVEALERLYRLAEDPDGEQPEPAWWDEILQRRSTEDESEPAKQAQGLATGLLQVIDPDLWDKSLYYRFAASELVEATELFYDRCWAGLKDPLHEHKFVELSPYRFGYFSAVPFPEAADEYLGRLRDQLPQRRLAAWLRRHLMRRAA